LSHGLDAVGDVGGIPPDSVDECRVVSELEWQTNEVKAWFRHHDASLVCGEVAAGGCRKFDPAVVVLGCVFESGISPPPASRE
jgi:hypothetical protein